jgi:hypothetical protein
LGASVFFKRGEGRRRSASLLLPTLASQLATRIRGFDGLLAETLRRDRQICSKALGEQFKRLIKEPLQQLPTDTAGTMFVVVIAALDECENEQDMRTVLDLWLFILAFFYGLVLFMALYYLCCYFSSIKLVSATTAGASMIPALAFAVVD